MPVTPIELHEESNLLSSVCASVQAGTSPERAFEEAVSYEDRKRRGQFFTPPTIARAMVRWACVRGPETFLDPAVGPGVFPEELRRASIDSLRQITGVDTDPIALGVAAARLGSNEAPGVELLQHDFLSLPLDAPYDAIVCNPPYVRHHDAKLSETLFDAFEAQFGLRLSRLTNVYCLFLLKIMASLSERGRAAVITPTEFLNADFGRAIKRILLESGRLRGFIHFDYASSVFDGIMTTATITLLDAAAAGGEVAFVKIDDADAIDVAFDAIEASPPTTAIPPGLQRRTVARHELDADAKWATSQFTAPPVHVDARLRPLSDFATCNRGIATGANGFFTLTDAELERWAIPDSAVRPCITKAMHAPSAAYTHQDHAALRAAGRKAWLLDVSELQAHQITPYLEHGESLGIHRRYLTRHRRAWYLTEQREPADIWVTTFARGRLRFIHNQAIVLNLTAFHCIYLKPAYQPHLPMLVDYFQSSEFDAVCAREHRVYGDGLLKVEPRDVERLLVPDLDCVSS